MLMDLKYYWPSLQLRRSICDISMFYQIHRGHVNISLPHELTSVPAYSRTRASHDFKISLPFSSVDAYKHSFYVRSIPAWNALPPDIVTSGSSSEFISSLYVLHVYFNLLCVRWLLHCRISFANGNYAN